MFRPFAFAGLMLLGSTVVAGYPGLTRADDAKQAGQGGAVKASKLEKVPVARTIDFSGSFKLSFASLTTLGSRIDDARMAADPVALASAARELAVAERISGKKASLTANELTEEVVTLAKLRNQSQELEAVALLLDNEGSRPDLRKEIDAAKRREAEAAEAIRSGETSRGLQGTLIVNNLHNVAMAVYTNGQFRGVTPPFRTGYYYVDNPPGMISVFEVRYPDGSSRARWVLTDNVPSFTWNIDPNVP